MVLGLSHAQVEEGHLLTFLNRYQSIHPRHWNVRRNLSFAQRQMLSVKQSKHYCRNLCDTFRPG